MKALIAALLLSTVARAGQVEPITVGSVVDSYNISHVFICGSIADVMQARKHPGFVRRPSLVSSGGKGCAFLKENQYGVVLGLDKKAGMMRIEVDDSAHFGDHGPQVFTNIAGWFATKIDE